MMKKLIILSSLAVRYIDFEALKKAGSVIWLVMDQAEKANFPSNLEKIFLGISVIQNGHQDGPVVELDEPQARDAVSNLISQDPDAEWRIVSLNERNVLLAARLSHFFGLPALKESDLKYYHDKVLMKERLQSQGVRVPYYSCVDMQLVRHSPRDYFKQLSLKLGLPFIIKPIDSAGSYGVEKITSLDEFLTWANDPHKPESLAYDAEEFIEGELFHCDTAVEHGKTIFTQCCRYTCPNMEFAKKSKVLGSIVLPPTDPLRQKLLDFADRALVALGKIDTVSHMEIFVTASQELIFLEVGARPPGASAALMYQHDFGMSFANLYFRVLAQIPYEFKSDRLGYSLWAYLPKNIGVVEKIIQPNLLGSYEVDWFIQQGDQVEGPLSMVDPAGKLFVKDNNYLALQQDFEFLKQYQPCQMVNFKKLDNQ